MVSKGPSNVVITGGRSLLAAQLAANMRLDETMSCVCIRFDRGRHWTRLEAYLSRDLSMIWSHYNQFLLIQMHQFWYIWQGGTNIISTLVKKIDAIFQPKRSRDTKRLEVLPKTQVRSVLCISSISTDDYQSVSGWAAAMCETMLRHYASVNDVEIIILRMPQYIPYFDTEQFQGNFSKWAQQFWNKGVFI